jgi:hypothetical protein
MSAHSQSPNQVMTGDISDGNRSKLLRIRQNTVSVCWRVLTHYLGIGQAAAIVVRISLSRSFLNPIALTLSTGNPHAISV